MWPYKCLYYDYSCILVIISCHSESSRKFNKCFKNCLHKRIKMLKIERVGKMKKARGAIITKKTYKCRKDNRQHKREADGPIKRTRNAEMGRMFKGPKCTKWHTGNAFLHLAYQFVLYFVSCPSMSNNKIWRKKSHDAVQCHCTVYSSHSNLS